MALARKGQTGFSPASSTSPKDHSNEGKDSSCYRICRVRAARGVGVGYDAQRPAGHRLVWRAERSGPACPERTARIYLRPTADDPTANGGPSVQLRARGLTFFAASSRSCLRKAANCSGVSPTGSKPRLARNFSLNSAVLTIFAESVANLATMSRGVPAGAASAEVERGVEVRQARLGEGRHIRDEALRACPTPRAPFILPALRCGAAPPITANIVSRRLGHDVLQPLNQALVGNVLHVEPVHRVEPGHRQVVDAAGADRAVVELAGFFFA